jgi:prefoldin alpha subunit
MSEQRLQQTLSAIDISKAQLENLSRQQEMVRSSLEEHTRAKETVEQISKAEEGEEILVPVGAGVFLHAKVGSKKSGIANVGASIMMERGMQEIVKMLDSRMEELRKASAELDEQTEKIAYAIEQLSADAQQQYVQLQKLPKTAGKSK